MVRAVLRDGDKDVAVKAWLGVIALARNNSLAAQAHFGLAGIYRQQGDAAKAESEIREFRRLQSK